MAASRRPLGATPGRKLSPLGRIVAEADTDIWNDSCAVDELEYALSFGAVGATANPTIVVDVWNGEPRSPCAVEPGLAAGRRRPPAD